jgi:hypothetical protein
MPGREVTRSEVGAEEERRPRRLKIANFVYILLILLIFIIIEWILLINEI